MMDPEDMQSAIIELEAYAEEQEKRIDRLVQRVDELESSLNRSTPGESTVSDDEETFTVTLDYPLNPGVGRPYDPTLHMTMIRDDEPRSPVRRFLDRLWQITGW